MPACSSPERCRRGGAVPLTPGRAGAGGGEPGAPRRPPLAGAAAAAGPGRAGRVPGGGGRPCPRGRRLPKVLSENFLRAAPSCTAPPPRRSCPAAAAAATTASPGRAVQSSAVSWDCTPASGATRPNRTPLPARRRPRSPASRGQVLSAPRPGRRRRNRQQPPRWQLTRRRKGEGSRARCRAARAAASSFCGCPLGPRDCPLRGRCRRDGAASPPPATAPVRGLDPEPLRGPAAAWVSVSELVRPARAGRGAREQRRARSG